jgi:hypothetical protein
MNLRPYIDSLKAEFPGREEFLDYCWDAWEYLSGRLSPKTLEVPDACIGNASGFMYTWRKDNFYLECEIFEDRTIEFFYKQKTEIDYEEWALGKDLPSIMVKRLMYFCA